MHGNVNQNSIHLINPRIPVKIGEHRQIIGGKFEGGGDFSANSSQIVQNLKEPFLERIPVKVSNILKNITIKFLRNKKGFEEILQMTTKLEQSKPNRFEKIYNKTE